MNCMFITLPVSQLHLEPCLEMLGIGLVVSHSPSPENCSRVMLVAAVPSLVSEALSISYSVAGSGKDLLP